VIKIGTNHFVSVAAAENYYASQGFQQPKQEVRRKIAEQLIVIGPPKVEEGIETLSIDFVEGRYNITISEPKEY